MRRTYKIPLRGTGCCGSCESLKRPAGQRIPSATWTIVRPNGMRLPRCDRHARNIPERTADTPSWREVHNAV